MSTADSMSNSYTALLDAVYALRWCQERLHEAAVAAGPNVGSAIEGIRREVDRHFQALSADLAELHREAMPKSREDESCADEHEAEMRRIGRTPEGTGRA